MQEQQPNPPISLEERSLLIQKEVCTFLEKGAVTKVPNPQPQEFLLNSLQSPKKGGQMRLVINLKTLNE